MVNYHVTKNPDGGWDAKKAGGQRASGNYNTQKEAEQAAKKFVKKLGGGEVRIHGLDGKIRDSDTVAPGNDPRDIRDTKH